MFPLSSRAAWRRAASIHRQHFIQVQGRLRSTLAARHHAALLERGNAYLCASIYLFTFLFPSIITPMLKGGSGLQPHDKAQGTKDMSLSQFSRTSDFREKTAILWHSYTSLLSFPIKGQQRTRLLHHYNSFYMKFSIYLDKGNVIRELSEIPSRYQTSGISLRNLPSSWITAYEKKNAQY